MILKHLNKLVSKKIKESGKTKTYLAKRARLPLSTFMYRYNRGRFDWDDIKRFNLNITKEEFFDAIEKDFKQ